MPLTYEHVGSKKPAKIHAYMLTRTELLITLCYEILCISSFLLGWNIIEFLVEACKKCPWNCKNLLLNLYCQVYEFHGLGWKSHETFVYLWDLQPNCLNSIKNFFFLICSLILCKWMNQWTVPKLSKGHTCFQVGFMKARLALALAPKCLCIPRWPKFPNPEGPVWSLGLTVRVGC